MVQTRSMSKTDTKTATDTKIVERASKQTRKKARKNVDCYLKRTTIDIQAMLIFMEDYMIRHPPPNIEQFDAVDIAGQKEWRQMSALEKAPFIKTAVDTVMRLIIPDSREPPPNPNAKELTMVQTRSMSKTDTKTATDTKIVERASKQTRKKARKNVDCYLKRTTIDIQAMLIFMEDYMIRHPPPNIEQFDAVDIAGQKEWRQMSALEKAPFIKTAVDTVMRLIIPDSREPPPNPNAKELTMVQTRSMSKTDTKTATDTKIVERASKQTRKKARKNVDCYLKRTTIDIQAMLIFMEDYMIRHPPPNIEQFDAVDIAGQKEWRQMSALEKAPFIKTAVDTVMRLIIPDSREPPPNPNAKELTMVQTRSMSKTDTKTATDTKIVVRASKQTRKKAKKNADCYLKRPTIDIQAMLIFMEDYMIRHPLLNIDQFDAVDIAGQEEWRQMSALEKAPFIKTAMERKERRAKPTH